MRLRTINHHLRRFGFVFIVQTFDEPEATERGHTGLAGVEEARGLECQR